jgi:hypothetical protein
MAGQEHIHELATRTVIAIAAGATGLVGPDAAAAATALTPIAEEALGQVVKIVANRRRDHAAETLTDAAEAAGVTTDEEFVEFLNDALSDESKQELLIRALLIAQDSAMRDKRRAIGRSIAAAMNDMDTLVDDELIFLRTLDGLDAPHIKLLKLMAETSSGLPQRNKYLNTWKPAVIPFHAWGLRGSAKTLMTVLEQYGLIESDGEKYPDPYHPDIAEFEYAVTDYGHEFLSRFKDPQ